MIKNRIKIFFYSVFKNWSYEYKNENVIRTPSKCLVHESVFLQSAQLLGEVRIDENSKITKSIFDGKTYIGKNNTIKDACLSGSIITNEGVKIIDGVDLSGNIIIGKYTTINGPNTDMRSAIHGITIGSFCSIARNVVFQEYNHDYRQLTTYMLRTNLEGKNRLEDLVSEGAINIGHDVWIGTHCVILSGAKIGTGAVIAANSVVSGEIPPYAIAAGSPAKVIKYRFDEKTIDELLTSKWWQKPKEEVVKLFNEFKVN